MRKIFLLTFFITPFICFSNAVKVPLLKNQWFYTPYQKNFEHRLEFSNEELTIHVDKSAGVLAYKFEKPVRAKEIRIKGSYQGKLKLKSSLQGSKDNDDFILRVGLIYSGPKKLTGIKKFFAPQWLKEIYSKFGKEGLGNIDFYSTYSDNRLKGKRRDHPNSSLIKEFFVHSALPEFDYLIDVDSDRKAVGLWIATDGDDTGSSFKLHLSEISFQKF